MQWITLYAHSVCSELMESMVMDWRGVCEPKHAVFHMTLMGLVGKKSSVRCLPTVWLVLNASLRINAAEVHGVAVSCICQNQPPEPWYQRIFLSELLICLV